MLKHASRRRGLVLGAALGLVIAPLTVIATSAPALADPAGGGLVIREVYGAGGNSASLYNADFVELYNPTSAAIALSGKTLQYRSSGGSVGGTVSFTAGSVPAGSPYLVQMSAASATTGDPLPTPDHVASPAIAMAAAGGQTILGTQTTYGAGDLAGATGVIDMVGQSGAGSYETAPASVVASSTLSLNRTASGADTDSNLADIATAAPSPEKAVTGASPLAATDPGDQTATRGQAITPFTLTATGGTTPYAWSATGLPDGISVDTGGTVSGTPTAAGDSTVEATVTDAATPTPATASTTFDISVNDPAVPLTIAEIQGDDTDTSPYAGQGVTTTGVVTAAFPTGGLDGFYLQTGGTPATPAASDGIFVYAGSKLTPAQYPTLGSTVTVAGAVSEYFGSTQISISGPSDVTVATPAQPAVVPAAVIPGTDCALPGDSCLTGAALDAARERHEGELFAPTGSYTVTDVYDGSPAPSTSSSFFGEIGLAAHSDTALVQPTELFDAQTEGAKIAARTAYNDAHRVILDDGSSTNYSSATGSPFPWFTADHYVRNGAAVTFDEPVVLTYANSTWKIQPSGGQVVGAPTGQVTFSQDRPAAPEEVGGDLRLATFNVLNYFPTTGAEYVASGLGTCTFYNDRAGNPITNRSCNPDGPRGAANAANLERQQDKIVHAINGLDAAVVSLEEIENSVKFAKDRDFALSTLVDALNADAGAGTWAFAPSPSPANLPTLAQQDVIRTAFIYKPAAVVLVGDSEVLTTESSDSAPVGAFANAREPLAQGFKGVGQPDSKAFAVIVNHFKSKSGTNDGTGQGGSNPDRVRQAEVLKTFAADFAGRLGGSGAVFLTGDFNAYTQEDPVQVLTEGGYTQLESTTAPDEESYNFAGLDGSLDHVFANAAAEAMVTGVDIWNINADESVYQEYSRYNSNVTDLYSSAPFRASDHNPEVVGLDLNPAAAPVEVQILATNDFHGRIQNDAFSASAGAAVLAGAVKQLRSANPNTTFAAAGDLIGASTFESFIAQDKPTIDALNEAGLEVSAAGNHEFDQGYEDLVERVMADYDAETNPFGGAQWKYLGANVKFKDSGDPALDGTWIKDQGGVQVGFIGAVTEHLPELVSPAGIADIEVTDVVEAANDAADDLKAAGADVVVLLVHEGAPGTDCGAIGALGADTDFGSIVQGVGDDIDAIVSGHTHLTYNCSFPVAGWSGRPVTERPVVSAGQYGYNLNQLVFTVDPVSGEVQAKSQSVLALKSGTSGSTFNYPIDGATQSIVDAAVANAEVLGAVPLGKIGGTFKRAKLANGTTENRGGESTLGNLVAEIQKWATTDPAFGAAQIALMNPGGLRADLIGSGEGFPKTVTYKQAANVQPFANTLVNMDLTGAQLKATLEQQWQPAGASRPFLKLGISKGFTYTYDPGAGQGERVSAMYLDGEPVDLGATYSVTVNSFLASGGDNFTTLTEGARKQDTGRTDLQAQVDYFAEFAKDAPLPVDYSQRAVGVDMDSASHTAGDDVVFGLSSLSMTGAATGVPNDVRDTSVDVSLDGRTLGSFPVTTAVQTALPGYDEAGTATAVITLPIDAAGASDLVVTGNSTGTVTRIPITIEAAAPVEVQILATNDFHGRIQNDAFSASAGAAVLAGAVKQLRSANPNTTFAAAGDLIGASTFESFIAQDKPTIDALNEAGLEVSAAGNHEFDQGYEDLVERVMADYDAETNPFGGAQWKYLGANVKFKDSGDPALDGTWIKDQGGVQVGFIGAVTEHLPELVSPAGIADIEVTDVVEAANDAADDLKAAGADVVVLLVHEGAPGTDCGAIGALGADTDFGSIVQGVGDDIDAIVSGHTHLTYNCSFPVAGWSGRPVTERPVVSAGQYGYNLNQLVFTVDPVSGEVQAKSQSVLALKSGTSGSTFNYPIDGATQSIVDAAVANAEVLGAVPLGKIGGTFKRAKLANGTTENRGGESTLGNLVAEIQKWATTDPAFGAAQIALMNPGGLRADLIGSGEGFPKTVTYKQAANVQPFANTLVNMDLTGAQLKATLEQQWQPAGASRPFLKLGISKGFTYTYDPGAGQGERVSAMYLDGEPVDLGATYSVTVNSFLASGGDNFTTLTEGARKQDTGRTDLQAQVDYFAEFAKDAPLPVDYSQRAVGVDFGDDAAETFGAGDEVSFDLSSLSMTGAAVGVPDDVKDSSVEVSLDGEVLGSFEVTTTVQSALPGYDEAGTATAVITLPEGLAGGSHDLVVTGDRTDTEALVPITVEAAELYIPTVSAAAVPNRFEVKRGTTINVTVSSDGPTPTGEVEVRFGTKVIGAGSLDDGKVAIEITPWNRVGTFPVNVAYLGDDVTEPATDAISVRVIKQTPTMKLSAPSKVSRGDRPVVRVLMSGFGAQVAGEVRFVYQGKQVVKTLKNNRVALRLVKLKRTAQVKVRYFGNRNFAPVGDTIKIKVAR